jgi:putative transposase
VRRAYKLRAYPTRSQENRAVRLLADHCDLYNAALAERREAWRMHKVRVSYGDQSGQLKEIRAGDPGGQGRHSFTAQQQTLRRLNTVLAAYFKRARGAKGSARRVGYPRFKPYQRFDQVLFVAGDGARWEPADANRWAHASFHSVGRVKSVGVDLGVARFLTTSDGEIIANPRFLKAAQGWIVDLQRRKERARPGSGNRRRLRRALAKEWRRLRNQRRDFHHNTARGLVDTCDTIAVEELRAVAMTVTASGAVEAPGRNVAAKAGLNRSILDAGWGQFTSILVAKAESAGRRVVLVNPASTSIDCHTCGARCTRPRQDTVVCPTHGALDADLNGARNIATRAGLGSGQASAA